MTGLVAVHVEADVFGCLMILLGMMILLGIAADFLFHTFSETTALC